MPKVTISSPVWVLAFLALCAGASGGEPIKGNVDFPDQWTVFAPLDRRDGVLPVEVLKTIPETIALGERRLKAQTVNAAGGKYDFTPYFGVVREEKVAYVFLELPSPAAQDVTLGMGADWWMQAWVNGKLVMDTTATGNGKWPPSINDYRAAVSLRKGRNVLAVRFISGSGSSVLALGGPAELRAGDFAIPPKPGEPGPMADKYSRDESSLRPTSGWAPRFVRKAKAPERGRVALNVDWADNRASESVVTFGVPFPRGALASAENVRLVDAADTPVPGEIRSVATWERRDGPVRWAQIHARMKRGESYALEYGKQVHPPSFDGLKLTDAADRVTIDTGKLRAVIGKRSSAILASAAFDFDGNGRYAPNEMVVRPDEAVKCLPRVVDGRGRAYPAAKPTKVEVVEAGPVRAAVRREGWYTSADGVRFCQYVTYTYFHLGDAGFRHDHTLVVAFDTHEHEIRDLSLPLPLALEGQRTAWFAADDGPDGSPVEIAAGDESLSLVQTNHDRWTLSRGKAGVREGTRAGGWFGLADERWGAFAGIRDFWQQFPAQLEVEGDRLNLHLWPARETPVLDFRPSTHLGEDYPGNRVFFQNHYRQGLDEMTQGYGLAKTHNLVINFFTRPRAKQAAWVTRAFQKPVLCMAEPKWNCRSEAFGRAHPYDPKRFPKIEALIDALVHRRWWLRERLKNYGWIHFGDVNHNMVYTTDPKRISWIHWRRWGSMFHGYPNVMPLLYMRSGRRDAWELHRANVKHITDIDICHLYHKEFGKWRGGRYGGNGGIFHFSASPYSIGCDHHLRFMLYDYYLNGDLRAREVANYYMKAHAARRELPHNVVWRHRMTGGSLRFFCEAYQATWDPEYLSLMRQFADINLQAYLVIDESRTGVTRYDDIYMNEGRVLYYQLTGDERMRKLFLGDLELLRRNRDCHVYRDTRGTTMYGLARAYWMTDDPSFLPFALWQLDVALKRVPATGKPYEIGAIGWTEENPYSSTLGNQLPYIMTALAETKDVPPMAGPAIRGAGAVYINETKDRDFAVKVKCDVYSRPDVAYTFTNWPDWAARLPQRDRPALVLLAPDGSEVQRYPLSKASNRMVLRAPADGKTGAYIIKPTSAVAPVGLEVLDCDLRQRVHHAGRTTISGASHYFAVPRGTGQFSLVVKGTALRGRLYAEVSDARGRVVLEKNLPVGVERWTELTLDAGSPAGDEAWSISFVPPLACYVEMKGVPGYVASSPAELFTPSRRVEAPDEARLPTGDSIIYADAGLPWGGKAAVLPAGVGLKIAGAAPGKKLMMAAEGTIETWLKCDRDRTVQRNRSLLLCGALNIYQRTNIGTYFYIGRAGHQTGFVLPRGRWTHLAAVWRTSVRGGLEVNFFADGVFVRTSYPHHLKADGDWPGAQILIPPAATDLSIAALRVSARALHQADFTPSTPPFARDIDTLVLCHFNGDGKAWVLGKEEALKVVRRH